jgi:hypothetical protein
MASISNYVLDGALSLLAEANEIHICSAEPTSYGVLGSLGNSVNLSVGAPEERPAGGRQVTVAAIADGDVTANGLATHYALVDTTSSRLLITGSLNAGQTVTAGNTFSLAAFTIGIPDPA